MSTIDDNRPFTTSNTDMLNAITYVPSRETRISTKKLKTGSSELSDAIYAFELNRKTVDESFLAPLSVNTQSRVLIDSRESINRGTECDSRVTHSDNSFTTTTSSHDDADVTICICPVCGFSASSPRGQDEHMELYHGEDKSDIHGCLTSSPPELIPPTVFDMHTNLSMQASSTPHQRSKRFTFKLESSNMSKPGTCTYEVLQTTRPSANRSIKVNENITTSTNDEYETSNCDKPKRLYSSETRQQNNHSEVKENSFVNPVASMRKVDSRRRYRCNICPATFPWHGDLTEHLRSEHGMQKSRENTRNGKAGNFCCSHCKYVAKYQSELRRHMRLHWGVKPFICVFCPYRSAWKGDLKRHMESHHRERFNSESELIKIMSQFKNNAGTITSLSSLATANGYTSESPTRRDRLRKSPRRPINPELKIENDYDEDDSKQLIISDVYSHSISSHTSEPEPLDQLNNSDCTEKSQTAHSTYSNDPSLSNRELTCEICLYKAQNQSKLTNHLASHINLKQFKCPLCDQRSNYKWDIKKHMKKQHPDCFNFSIELLNPCSVKLSNDNVKQANEKGVDTVNLKFKGSLISGPNIASHTILSSTSGPIISSTTMTNESNIHLRTEDEMMPIDLSTGLDYKSMKCAAEYTARPSVLCDEILETNGTSSMPMDVTQSVCVNNASNLHSTAILNQSSMYQNRLNLLPTTCIISPFTMNSLLTNTNGMTNHLLNHSPTNASSSTIITTTVATTTITTTTNTTSNCALNVLWNLQQQVLMNSLMQTWQQQQPLSQQPPHLQVPSLVQQQQPPRHGEFANEQVPDNSIANNSSYYGNTNINNVDARIMSSFVPSNIKNGNRFGSQVISDTSERLGESLKISTTPPSFSAIPQSFTSDKGDKQMKLSVSPSSSSSEVEVSGGVQEARFIGKTKRRRGSHNKHGRGRKSAPASYNRSNTNSKEEQWKRHQCSGCGHRSNWKWDINKHIKVAHPERTNITTLTLDLDEAKRTFGEYMNRLKLTRNRYLNEAAAGSPDSNLWPSGSTAIGPYGPINEGYYRPYKCSICGHRSNWKWDVRKHIKQMHNGDAEVITLSLEEARRTIHQYKNRRRQQQHNHLESRYGLKSEQPFYSSSESNITSPMPFGPGPYTENQSLWPITGTKSIQEEPSSTNSQRNSTQSSPLNLVMVNTPMNQLTSTSLAIGKAKHNVTSLIPLRFGCKLCLRKFTSWRSILFHINFRHHLEKNPRKPQSQIRLFQTRHCTERKRLIRNKRLKRPKASNAKYTKLVAPTKSVSHQHEFNTGNDSVVISSGDDTEVTRSTRQTTEINDSVLLTKTLQNLAIMTQLNNSEEKRPSTQSLNDYKFFWHTSSQCDKTSQMYDRSNLPPSIAVNPQPLSNCTSLNLCDNLKSVDPSLSTMRKQSSVILNVENSIPDSDLSNNKTVLILSDLLDKILNLLTKGQTTCTLNLNQTKLSRDESLRINYLTNIINEKMTANAYVSPSCGIFKDPLNSSSSSNEENRDRVHITANANSLNPIHEILKHPEIEIRFIKLASLLNDVLAPSKRLAFNK